MCGGGIGVIVCGVDRWGLGWWGYGCSGILGLPTLDPSPPLELTLHPIYPHHPIDPCHRPYSMPQRLLPPI